MLRRFLEDTATYAESSNQARVTLGIESDTDSIILSPSGDFMASIPGKTTEHLRVYRTISGKQISKRLFDIDIITIAFTLDSERIRGVQQSNDGNGNGLQALFEWSLD